MRNGKLFTAPLLLGNHSCKQTVKFAVAKVFDRA